MTNGDVADTLPPVLYHYTDSVGLQGILGPGQGPMRFGFPEGDKSLPHRYLGDDNLYWYGKSALFRATDIRYMNDSLELAFGATIVNERLRAAAADHTLDDALRSAFLAVAEAFDPDRVFDWPFRCFAVCFCERGDLLSQWRGYAGGVGGFSVGFRSEVLDHFSYGFDVMAAGNIRDMPIKADLVQVAYGKDAAGVRADALVAELKSQFEAGLLIKDPDGRPSFLVALAAFRAIAGMKHDAFDEEREWRLIAVSQNGQQVRTRSRASGVVPYMDVAVNSRIDQESDPASPLVEVVVGPSSSPEGQILAVRDLLKSRGTFGFEEVAVVPSAAPFRQ